MSKRSLKIVLAPVKKRLRTNELFFDVGAPFKSKVQKSKKNVYKRKPKNRKESDL